MKKFIALYHAPAAALNQAAHVSPAEHEAGMKKWFEWKSRNEEAVLDFGAPLSTGSAYDQTGNRSDSYREVCGFSVLQEKDEAALQQRLEDHPHFLWHPEATIELHEVLDV